MCCSSEKQRLEKDRWRYETSFNFSNVTNQLDKRQNDFFSSLSGENCIGLPPTFVVLSVSHIVCSD